MIDFKVRPKKYNVFTVWHYAMIHIFKDLKMEAGERPVYKKHFMSQLPWMNTIINDVGSQINIYS